MDLYYYESGYIEDGYFGYTADAVASFELTCSISAVIGVVKGTNVNLTASFNQTCDVDLGNLVTGQMFGYLTALMAIEVSLIRDNNTQLNSSFDISAIGMRVRYVSAQCDTDAAISFDQIRIRTESAAIDAVFSSIVTANKVINFSASITDAFSPTITCNPIRNHFAQLDSVMSLSVTPTITKGSLVSLSSNFTQVTQAKVSKTYSSQLTSSASIYSYGTFNNKRPRSITRVGNSIVYSPSYPSGINEWSDLGLFGGTGSDSLVPYAAYRYYRIENKSKTPILANQSFYISFYTYFISGNNGSILNADAWEIGSTSSTFYFRFNSSTISVNVGSNYQTVFKIEVYRISSLITLKVTNTVTSTVYLVTLTSSASATPTNDYIVLSSVSTPIIIDELFFTIGESQVYGSKPNGEINDGWRSTTQFLYHFNNDYVDDMSGGVYNVPAALTSTATLTCDAIKSIYGSAALTSNLTLTCDARLVPIEYNAVLSSSFTQSTVGTKVLYATATLNTTVGFLINEIIVKTTSVSMSAFVIKMVIVSRKVGEVASLTTNATLTCNSDRTRKLTSGLGLTATLVCNSDRTRKTSSALSVTSTLTCNSVRTRKLESNLNAFVTEMVIVTRRKEEVANLTMTSTLTASFGVLGFNRSHLIANFTVIAINDRVRKFGIQSQSTFNLTVQISKSISTNAVLLTTTSLLAIGTRFYLDPELTYIVPNESREWIIQYEDRKCIIEQEDRTHIIGK